MPSKSSKSDKSKLMVRSVLVNKEIDDALNTEAANRGWGKSKLIRYILSAWLSHWKASRRPIKLPDIDRERADL